ncbi:MAG: PASTA domain-containing protein [Treponema sp.]|jgi:beta-lactam-binding protein with PASTA domain|nr:PASTA domain-containing protein [Treponema sp.]
MKLIRFDFDAMEDYVANHLRLFISMAAGLLVFVGLIALSVFFFAVRGAEETMVPEVRGKELTEALLELQVKELDPRIRLRHSQSSADRGLVLEQDPGAGAIVKAGRRVWLVVSQGVIIDRVENYVGRNIDEVRMDLQTLFASSSQPLLSLKEPFMYQHSAEAPGVILRQSPEPGREISGPVALELVVSLGPENVTVTVPGFTGLSISGALERLGRMGMNFVFTVREPAEGEKGETVTAQSPPEGTQIRQDGIIRLTAVSPGDLEEGEVFSLFTWPIPKNPYPLPVRLDAILPSGEERRIITVEYPGGDFTVPYRLPVGTTLVLSMVNREMYRETVRPPRDLFMDQL